MTRRNLFRISILSVLIVILSGSAISLLTNPKPLAPPARPGDCTEIQVSDNGWHTNVYLPASAFPATHAFRRDYPFASWFVIGWGDESFYRYGPTVLRGLDAIIPPSPTVVHVIALDAPPGTYFLDRSTPVSLSRAGLSQVAAQIDASLSYNAEGEAISVSEGHYPGASRFYRSDFSYHAFRTCNQWTAGVLRKSGADINAPVSMMSGVLMWQLQNAYSTCTTAKFSVKPAR